MHLPIQGYLASIVVPSRASQAAFLDVPVF
jgi:hypothetical protein